MFLQSLYFSTSTPCNPFIFLHLLPAILLFFYIYSLQSLYYSTSTPCNPFIFLHLLPAIVLFFNIYSLQSLYYSTSTPCNPFIFLCDLKEGRKLGVGEGRGREVRGREEGGKEEEGIKIEAKIPKKSENKKVRGRNGCWGKICSN